MHRRGQVWMLVVLTACFPCSCGGATRIADPAYMMYGNWSGSIYPASRGLSPNDPPLLLTITRNREVAMMIGGSSVPVRQASVGAYYVEFMATFSGREYHFEGFTSWLNVKYMQGLATLPDSTAASFGWYADRDW